MRANRFDDKDSSAGGEIGAEVPEFRCCCWDVAVLESPSSNSAAGALESAEAPMHGRSKQKAEELDEDDEESGRKNETFDLRRFRRALTFRFDEDAVEFKLFWKKAKSAQQRKKERQKKSISIPVREFLPFSSCFEFYLYRFRLFQFSPIGPKEASKTKKVSSLELLQFSAAAALAGIERDVSGWVAIAAVLLSLLADL